jgi:hypothetical protein
VEYLKSQQKKVDKLSKELGEYQKLWEGIHPVALVARVAKVLPKGTIITAFTITKNSVEVEGLTPKVPELLEKLGSQKWIVDLKLLYSHKNGRFGEYQGERFRIRFRVSNEKHS